LKILRPVQVVRRILLIGLLAATILMLSPAMAQGDPFNIIDAAYRDLSQRLGQTIARGGANSYSWQNEVWPDTSLGCPQQGQTYVQRTTAGYQITLYVSGSTYDYRATQDGSTLFLCAGTGAATIIAPTANIPPTAADNTLPNTPIPTSAPAVAPHPIVVLLVTGKAFGGDFFLWGWPATNFVQKTTWGWNYNPVIAPNGSWVAYLSTPTAVVNGHLTPNYAVANVWLMSLPDGTTNRIGDQPQNAAAGTFVNRSAPVWSPDSASVAWIEQDSSGTRLTTYDINQKQLLVRPFTTSDTIASLSLHWAQAGLAVTSLTRDSQGNHTVVFFQTPSATPTTFTTQGDVLDWITTPNTGKQSLAVWISAGNKWQVIDPATGQASDMGGVPELYSSSAPTGASIVQQSAFPFTSASAMQLAIGGASVPLTNVVSIAISPDGQAVAVETSNPGSPITISLYAGNSNPTSAPVTTPIWNGIVWGPTAWRIHMAQ
jgi:hypothetical protein